MCGDVTRRVSPSDGSVDVNRFRCHRILFVGVFVKYVAVQFDVRRVLRECLPQNCASLRSGCNIGQFCFCSLFLVSIRFVCVVCTFTLFLVCVSVSAWPDSTMVRRAATLPGAWSSCQVFYGFFQPLQAFSKFLLYPSLSQSVVYNSCNVRYLKRH